MPAAEAATEAAPQRYILPKNLRNAVKHLSDGELDLMHAAHVDHCAMTRLVLWSTARI